MSIQAYKSPLSPRQEFEASMDMLEHAMGEEALSRFGMAKKHSKNKTDTVSFPRVKVIGQDSYGTPVITPSKYATQEGVTPTPTTIDYEEVRVKLRHYAILFKLTSDAELYHEHDIPSDMKMLTGEWIGEMKEKIAWGAIRSGTVVMYTNGSSRSSIASVISLPKINAAIRRLRRTRGKVTTTMLSTSTSFGSTSAPAGWYAFGHSDLDADVRALPGFQDVSTYRNSSTLEHEIGLVGKIHFVLTPVLEPWLAAGAAVSTTGLRAADSTNIDVYPLVITAKDSWGTLALRGADAISPTYFPAGQKSHSNPSGMFGYVGGDFRTAAFLANQNWVVRIETAVTEL